MHDFQDSGRVGPTDPIPVGFGARVADAYAPAEQAARSRAEWYGLLAGICHRPVGDDVVAAFGAVARRTEEMLGVEVAADWLAFSVAPDATAARQDYAALLKVPGGRYATPNESVWADTVDVEGSPRPKGLLMGPATVDMKARWRKIGREANPGSGELPDYLGMELHYLECLCTMEAEAWADEDAARARYLLDQQRSFLDDHVRRWVGMVGAKITTCASGDFFRGFGRVVPAFIEEDRQLLGVLLAPV